MDKHITMQPWFLGSSCTHDTSSRFGNCASNASISSSGNGYNLSIATSNTDSSGFFS